MLILGLLVRLGMVLWLVIGCGGRLVCGLGRRVVGRHWVRVVVDGSMVDGLMVNGSMVDGLMVDGLMVNGLMVNGRRVKWSRMNWGRVGMGMSTVVCQGQCGQGRKDGDLEGGLG